MPAPYSYETTEEFLRSSELGRQIIRIRENVSAALTAIGNKGVTVPSGSNSDDLADLIGSIQTGGGTPSATSHTILFDFTDETTQSITGYWDSSFISDAIRATIPTTVDGKTVTLAQFDGVTWYEPADIPIGVQLINYNDVLTGYSISADGSINSSDLWNCVTDYIEIDSSMTFTFACSQYTDIGFYDKNKNTIRTVSADEIKDRAEDYVAFGTLDSSIIPSGVAYIVMQGNSYSIEELSLIRTA